MTRKELAQILEIMIEKARRNKVSAEADGTIAEANYQRGKLDAYEIILDSLRK
jgi:hypothetical protein